MPCLNGGKCVEDFPSLNSSYTCECSSAYIGMNCEERIDFCQNETCLKSFVCFVDENNMPKCKCEIKSEEKKEIEAVISTASIIAIISLFMIYLLTIVSDLFGLYQNSKKKTISSPKQSNISKYQD
jgi:hypothetical protein